MIVLMRICCEWLYCEPFIEEYPLSPAETSCVLKMCEGYGSSTWIDTNLAAACTVDRFIKNLMMWILKTLQCFYLTRSQPTSQHKAIICCSSYNLQHLLTAALKALQFETLPQLPRLQHASQSLLTDVYWQIFIFF